MALNVPNIFPASPGPIQTYNFFDIVNGLGYVTFYGGVTNSASQGNVFVLSNQVFYSNSVASENRIDGPVVYQRFGVGSFGVTFELPQKIGGPCIVNIPVGKEANSGNASNGCNPIVQFFKIAADGTQTAVSGEYSGATHSDNAAAFTSKMAAMKIIIDAIDIRKNDQLVMSLSMGVFNNAATATSGALAFDPQNRTETSHAWQTGPSVLSVQIPFKIDK